MVAYVLAKDNVRVQFSLPAPLSSYSIKVLHYIGNVETLDRYQLGAPHSALSEMDIMLVFETSGGSSILSGPANKKHQTPS